MRHGRLVLPLTEEVMLACYLCGVPTLFRDDLTDLPFCSLKCHGKAELLMDLGPPRYATAKFCPIKANNKRVINSCTHDKGDNLTCKECAKGFVRTCDAYDDCPMAPLNHPKAIQIDGMNGYYWGFRNNRDHHSGDDDRVLAESDYILDTAYDIEQDTIEGVLDEDTPDGLPEYVDVDDDHVPMGILGIVDNPHMVVIVSGEESDFYADNDTIGRMDPHVITRVHFRKTTPDIPFLKGMGRTEKQCACYSRTVKEWEKDEEGPLLTPEQVRKILCS